MKLTMAMNTKNIKPIILDILSLRDERQKINNNLCIESIKNKKITKNINLNAWQSVVKNLNLSENQIFDKCENDDIFTKLLSMKISINSSRQGAKDEEIQINTCNITSLKFGIMIKKLSASAFRPLKSGKIVSNKQFKQEKILKNDCLKSFDAKISGAINGWVFAKVVVGDGGHQDNVFVEAYEFCNWVTNHGDKSELFILLIDTNLTQKLSILQEKFINIDNLIIGDHIAIQEYFIKKYSI